MFNNVYKIWILFCYNRNISGCLSSLFEDFPLEREKLNKLMNKETDTTKENHDAASESTE